jgi:hypothetical protein
MIIQKGLEGHQVIAISQTAHVWVSGQLQNRCDRFRNATQVEERIALAQECDKATGSREQLHVRSPKVSQTQMVSTYKNPTNQYYGHKILFHYGRRDRKGGLNLRFLLPSQASVGSRPSLNGGPCRFCPASPATLLDLDPLPDLEPRCLPSVAFTPSGPLV